MSDSWFSGWFDSSTAETGVATAPATTAGDSTEYFQNLGSNYDPVGTVTQGVSGDTTGTDVLPKTGNSLLDALGSFTSLSVNTLSKGLSAYGSFIEASAVADAAKRLNTTPQAVQGSLTTVPVGGSNAGVSMSNPTFLLGVGVVALVAFMVFTKK